MASPLSLADPPLKPLWPPLASYLSTRAGEVSVAVFDATDDRIYASQPALQVASASIVKVQIMGALLRQGERGGPLSPDDTAMLARMIEISDNDAATALWDRVGGGGGVGAFDRLVGMTATAPDPYGAWGNTTTNTVDQLRLLAAFAYPNRTLAAPDRQLAMSLLQHVDPSQSWGVSAGVPSGVTVALKNGWLPVGNAGWIMNSIGAVQGGGRNYLIAVLSENVPTYGYGIETIEGVSALVWRALSPDFDGGSA